MTEKKIETHGNQSPGYVQGDFIVNQTIVNQRNDTQRKQWRTLDEVDYPAIVDDEDRRLKYSAQLALHLHRAFKGEGYKRFTSFMSVRSKEFQGLKKAQGLDSGIIPVYCLITQQAKLSGELRKSWKTLWNTSLPAAERQGYQDALNLEFNELYKSWAFDIRPPFADSLIACQFVYDPDSKRISIGPPPVVSTTPSEYPDKIRTTSELLSFLFAVTQSPLINFGDIGWVKSHYPLFKLSLELLDNRSWMLEKIRINSGDPEDWDYINTSADDEVKRYEQDSGGGT